MDLLMNVAEGVALFGLHFAGALALMVGQIALTVAVLMALFLGIGLIAEALLYVFDPKSREVSRQIRAAKARKEPRGATGQPRKGR